PHHCSPRAPALCRERRPCPGSGAAGHNEEQSMSVTGPLSGVVIADLSRILAGPYCTLLLAEMGARVIKIETPGTGDDSRHYGPFVNGKSAYFVSINRGKE